ncbi:MAG: hypothetical protein HQM15_02005 [Deltaproteobacteria bacterium]|nr:hypothetical protein [Deltaproteobacteria bacterium]
MKKRNIGLLFGAFALGALGFLQPVKANTYRSLGVKDLSSLSKSPASIGFKGKVINIEDTKDHQRVTFEIQEVLRGDVPRESTLTLNFKKPAQLHTLGWPQQKVPVFSRDEESVLFVTQNVRGEDFFIGGEDQSRFYVKKVGSRSLIWNGLGNRNLIDTQSTNTLMRAIVNDMQGRNEGSIDYQDFKKLLDQTQE